MTAEARARLAARARRAARIRRGIVAGCLAAFALAWGVIAHSGAMGAETTPATAAATTGSSATGDSATSVERSGDGQSPMTTAQS
jgi:hypothetical protein